MNKDFKVKRANKGEEIILALLMNYEEKFNLKEGENETRLSFYIDRIRYDVNIKTKKISQNNLEEEKNDLSEEKEIIFEIIRNNEDKITFKKEAISKLNGLSCKENIKIIKELEKLIIKELNVTDEFEYTLSEPFVEYENKISIADTITNTELYQKSKESIKNFAKSIFNPELKDKAKGLLEQRGIDAKKAVESLKEKLEFSIPKTKLYFSEDGRQYLNHKNEWYMKTENEISYSNYLYDLLTKECYEIRDNEVIPFSRLESELDDSEKNLNEAKEHLKNAQIKNTSAIKMEYEIKTKRAQIQKIREKLEFVANNFFVKVKNITNYTEMELVKVANEIEKYLIEEELKNNDKEVMESILNRLTYAEKQAFTRVLSRNQK